MAETEKNRHNFKKSLQKKKSQGKSFKLKKNEKI